MFMLIVYDIDSSDIDGQKRLRTIAKTCEQYGVRVQNSVFELEIDNRNLIILKSKKEKIITAKDSVRFYKLGKNYKNNIMVFGHENKIEIKDDGSILL